MKLENEVAGTFAEVPGTRFVVQIHVLYLVTLKENLTSLGSLTEKSAWMLLRELPAGPAQAVHEEIAHEGQPAGPFISGRRDVECQLWYPLAQITSSASQVLLDTSWMATTTE